MITDITNFEDGKDNLYRMITFPTYCTAYLLYQFSLDHPVTLNSTDSNEVRRMFANFSVMDHQCKRANSNLRALLQNMARLPTLEIVLASLSGSLDMLHVRLKSIVIRGC